MILNTVEQDRFKTLLLYCHAHPKSIYKLVDQGDSRLAYYDTDYETDNGLEMDEPEYEEYQGIAFMNVNDGSLFEINYHNLPESVYDEQHMII